MTAKQPKKIRTITVLRRPGDGVGIVRITIGDTDTIYTLREIPCEIGGRGFAMSRLGLGEQYHIRIETEDESSCECMGFLRHGYCKHVRGLLALVQAGQI